MRTELILTAACTLAACMSCDRPANQSQPEPAPTTRAPKGPAGNALAEKSFFRVDAAAEQPACQVDTPCELRLTLTALGDYHVNENYPTKWIAEKSSEATVDGSGAFSPSGKTGTLALPFRASKAGTVKLAGTFKLSVCNDENCQIESPKIALDVPVRGR